MLTESLLREQIAAHTLHQQEPLPAALMGATSQELGCINLILACVFRRVGRDFASRVSVPQ